MFCFHCSKPLPATYKKYCSHECKRGAESVTYRERYLARYNAAPRLCKYCLRSLVYEKRKNTFCDSSCAATFNNTGRQHTEESNQRTAAALRRHDHQSFDWCVVQTYYDSGKSTKACQKKFGFSSSTWTDAKRRGLFVTRPPLAFDLEAALVEHGTTRRQNLKKHLILSGILKYVCAICGQEPEWRGKPLVLILDHINGINNDNRLENLRFLCPHCNSQMETFCRGSGKKPPVKAKEFVEALKTTGSIKEALDLLGMAPTGNNYARVTRLLRV